MLIEGIKMERITKVILSNMCMVENSKGEYCFINRHKNDWPGINLPGGHVEQGETLIESVIREMKEETGLTIKNPKLCAIKERDWGNDVRYLGLLYYTNEYGGELKSSDEGEVMWINYFKDKNRYHLSEGLEELIDLILSNK